jgi:hypothetical protein
MNNAHLLQSAAKMRQPLYGADFRQSASQPPHTQEHLAPGNKCISSAQALALHTLSRTIAPEKLHSAIICLTKSSIVELTTPATFAARSVELAITTACSHATTMIMIINISERLILLPLFQLHWRFSYLSNEVARRTHSTSLRWAQQVCGSNDLHWEAWASYASSQILCLLTLNCYLAVLLLISSLIKILVQVILSLGTVYNAQLSLQAPFFS